MASAAEVSEARRVLTALSESAQGDLLAELADLPEPDAIARMSDGKVADLYKAIRARWWRVAEAYGQTAAILGQEQAVAMLEDLDRATPPLRTVQGIRDSDATAAALFWALGQDDWQSALFSTLDAHLADANADAILTVADDAQGDVLWQPTGLHTCSYCLKRASYGAYSDFRSEAQKRGFQTKPHGGCDCRVVIVVTEDDWPDDYSPAAYGQEVARREREARERAYDRKLDGRSTPGPKTRENIRRDRSAKAWADRQRITAERDAAKKRLARAREAGDDDAVAAAQAALERTAAERARLNGTTT